MADTGTTPVVKGTAPASNLTSGQFINVQRLHIAKLHDRSGQWSGYL